MTLSGFVEGPPLWTDKNRAKYNRDHLSYPRDLTKDPWRSEHYEPMNGALRIDRPRLRRSSRRW
jgi:hypothetical protein